jgi:DNA-binding CsgD family transcriptional regulator
MQSIVTHGYDSRVVVAQLPACMAEFGPEDVRPSCGPGFAIDIDHFSGRRRGQLRLYREIFVPEGIRVVATRMWHNRFGTFGLHLARTGRGFSCREKRLLDDLAMPIELAELAFARVAQASHASPAGDESRFAAWAHAHGLSERERGVACLVTRGLRNVEVAEILGTSALTVRNQLKSVFRKTDVSTRAELVFSSLRDFPLRSADSPRRATRVAFEPKWIEIVAQHAQLRRSRGSP